MVDSNILSATSQSILLNTVSNIIAQLISISRTSHGGQSIFSVFDYGLFIRFVIFSLISTPVNCIWQEKLENTFPAPAGQEKQKKGETATEIEQNRRKLVVNTALKFLADQSIGAALNTILYVGVMEYLKMLGGGTTSAQVLDKIGQGFYPMLLAGYKFWPFVSLANFILVPVDQRVMVGGAAGFVWGVYLGLMG
ncbi:hypothetical protein FQN57_004715 [Myotisia sp. PD_48]|nr:hypothetical protein FQN57_004715 [Myotisia sp. PD_48]